MSDIVAMADFHGDTYSVERQLLSAAGYSLELLQTEEHLRNRADDIVALAIRQFPVRESLLQDLYRCRVVVRYGVGYGNVDVKAATNLGIIVACVPDYCTHEVAEQALTGAMLSIRCTLAFRQRVADGLWDAQACSARPSDAVQLVIIGLGRIGSALASKARGVGFPVAAFDPFVADCHFSRLGVERIASLEEALSRADILSLHVPLTRSPASFPTFRMIGRDEMAQMKPSAVLVNTARGPVVDNEALCSILEAGRLGGAVIDVLEDEPAQGTWYSAESYPQIDRLARLDNVVVTPHASFNSQQAINRVKELGTREICRVLRGESPRLEAWVNSSASTRVPT
jgi:D-3-phosphoglycerate dehydrogenase